MLRLSQEGACNKRKTTVQLTKDQLLDDKPLEEPQENGASEELREADPTTLKNRRRLKIVRTHGPSASASSEQQPAKEVLPEARVGDASNTAAEEAASSALDGAERELLPSSDRGETEGGSANGSSTFTTGASSSSSNNGNTANATTNNDSSVGGGNSGLFGSVLKGTSSFISPFGSLSASGSSFLLPSGGSAGSASLFGSPPPATPASEAEEADAAPPEEPTVVTTTVDSKEEVIFTDRDCRMQCFDMEKKAWAPKPPLDGKVDIVVPKEGEEEGLPNARILFFVNRTGRLRLNSPVLPSSVKFRHPVERAALSTGAAAGAAAAAAPSEGGDAAQKEEQKDLPLKLNTVEFTGLKIDAENSKDTTFYRIRFSSDARAAEFVALANAKQEEASKALHGGTNN
ncbi:ras guanine nucleotide exchange factor M [Cyclospora cayetanensis]|uniref:Ras guanine nucleotide exchange factor M n=1 Tax=Cyclospora cayetanensis TaxID=88456 RepID=A0A6P6S328_9EIME|nr:ras guanine nucleotide exchange factor M [Cyclospora cayetanensis]